ncbi:DUF1998 domain-containing protein [Salinispora arenicola]|uniref:DUF1998 domain-containing protein n=1 Tax=Salinispora arenicola TaxID=168697 RepID=UPI00039B2E1E|nr:DUF1998 domain-containing protein [Salinispora arenicola]
MSPSTRNVRRAQIIGPFGPGAIIDLVGESFVAEDASRWRGSVPIRMPRLAALLSVNELKSPSARRGVPYYRFPGWLFCQKCRLMTKWSPQKEIAGQPPMCPSCKDDRALVPMRFIAVCANGHLADIDWPYWAHREPEDRDQAQCGMRDKLYFRSRPEAGSGLASLEIECGACKARRSFERITSKGVLGRRCGGKQPWQSQQDAEPCNESLIGMQRGASSVYFPKVVSALDLPPDSDWDVINEPASRLRSSHEFLALVDNPLHALREGLLGYLAAKEGITPDEVARAVEVERGDRMAVHGPGTEDDIAPEEWQALLNPPDSYQNPLNYFVTRRADLPGLDVPLSDVILVDRLREVRVLKAFERYQRKQEVCANLDADADFLPAVEVFGEGWFLAFREDAVEKWANQPEVLRRYRSLAERVEKVDAHWLPPVTPRYVMLHTLAHLLMRNTAFEAGYPTSSLRERIYSTHPDHGPAMAGVLIYTAAGDTEGTLGGLVRMGEPERLSTLLENTIVEAQWCSLDPVCLESLGQGPGGLSLAACHACTLAPETSCQATNRLLDRQLLMNPNYGFFRAMVSTLNDVPGRGTW